MKKFPITIPIIIIVIVLAMWMLEKDYSEINMMTRLMISLGAGIFSGLISFFLFRFDKNHTN
ncbi:histidine kinase [Neobacillus sp. CF12]|uniref:histidine kinase n=1 Tax=Neobacillus sp. CF12 TaxID=3055864 RepID=UPI0025A2A34E|nr:histidine kinase [Neobacillus sp. CF12]MDM5331550.1 histidine kinase [Neobacillus sp. CF12]